MDLEAIGALLAQRRPGHALPQGLYSAQAAYAFDLAAIFGRAWILAGFTVELPKAGSWLSIMVGSAPVLITRDRSGHIAAFHNSCRHRGAQICPPGRGVSARLVCPYHAWTYEMSGELAHAPRMGEGFDRAVHGLGAIHVRVIAGVIYVCLADTPPDFTDFAVRAGPMIAPLQLEDTKLAHESFLLEKANWKLVMENARECYHCGKHHPELARSFPVELSGHFDIGETDRAEAFSRRMAQLGLAIGPEDGDSWQATRFALNVGRQSITLDGAPAVKRPIMSLGDGDLGSLRWANEPNAFCHATADHVFMFSAMPLGPKETLVTGKWLVHKDAVEGVDYDVENLTALWTATNLQDRALCENNQRGVDSPGYRPGPYSEEAESLTIRFVDWYCETARTYLEGR